MIQEMVLMNNICNGCKSCEDCGAFCEKANNEKDMMKGKEKLDLNKTKWPEKEKKMNRKRRGKYKKDRK